jgi:hypothetical protein
VPIPDVSWASDEMVIAKFEKVGDGSSHYSTRLSPPTKSLAMIPSLKL